MAQRLLSGQRSHGRWVTTDRRATGTHYTPRKLADEVVQYTLEPLCYNPGPTDGAPREHWQVRPAKELLDLKVLDPAMGSAASALGVIPPCSVSPARSSPS
jgi:hypothetical protein